MDVPHKNGERDAVVARFRELVTSGAALMVIPMAAVIEVGNLIAQLSGVERRDRAEKFAEFLLQFLLGTPPWVVSGATWDAGFLTDLS